MQIVHEQRLVQTEDNALDLTGRLQVWIEIDIRIKITDKIKTVRKPRGQRGGSFARRFNGGQ